jgi:acylphosphatase
MTDQREIQRGFRIRGSVQGVGFRWWTRRTAIDMGVRGTVRNCPDGSVEVRAAADAEVLEAFAHRLTTGAPMALVQAVEAFPSDGELPPKFEIGQWP